MKTGSCVSHQRIYRATNPNIASNRKTGHEDSIRETIFHCKENHETHKKQVVKIIHESQA